MEKLVYLGLWLDVAELHVAGRGVAVAGGSLTPQVVVTVWLQLETRLLDSSGLISSMYNDDADNSDQDGVSVKDVIMTNGDSFYLFPQ